MSAIKSNLQIDTSGKCCPMPMVETNKAMKGLNAGDVLEIIATDPATQQDIPSWCERQGHQLLESEHQAQNYIYRIKKR